MKVVFSYLQVLETLDICMDVTFYVNGAISTLLSSPTHRLPLLGITLPRTAWDQLNRLYARVGRFRSCLHKWGMASSAACECGVEEQTVDHVVLQHPTYRPPHGLHGLTVLDDVITEWLLNTCPEI